MRREAETERKTQKEIWFSLLDSNLRGGSSRCHFSIRRRQCHLGLSEDGRQEEGEAAAPGPVLTRAAASKGDRSKELLTGGSWHPTTAAPERCSLSTSFHREVAIKKKKKKSGKRGEVSFPSFLSHHAVAFFFFRYSPMWTIVGGIKYWCDPVSLILHFAVRAQVLSGCVSALKCTWRKVFGVLFNSCRRKIFPFHYWRSYYARARYFSAPSAWIWNLQYSSSLSPPLRFFPSLHPSSSQVGIHHHVGGRLTSDSFVNVNYSSLSEPRERGTCSAVRGRLRRARNNQPVFGFPQRSSTSPTPLTHPDMQI